MFVLSSASGNWPCNAWDKPHVAAPQPPQLALQPQLDSGLGEAENKVDHEHLPFRCSQMLSVQGFAEPIFFPHSGEMLESTHSIFLQGRKDVRNQISFFTPFTFQARGESTEGLWHKD